MTLPVLAGALAQVILFAMIGWVLGDLALRSLARKSAAADVGLPERVLISFAAFVAFAVVLMIGNIVSGGAFFGLAGVVPTLAVTVVLVWGRRAERPRGMRMRFLIPSAVLLLALWSLPVFASGSAAKTGDIAWHLGWTEQLLGGEPVPEGPAPEEVAENAYPWGFHALMATLVRLVPGTGPATSLVALQLLLLAAIPLAAAILARRLRPDAGWLAAGAVALVGGFGWLMARSAYFETSPGEARSGADLVVASPNGVYGLLPPPLPREVGLALLACAGFLLAVAITEARPPWLFAAGLVLGITGTVSVPLFLAGILWFVFATLALERGNHIRALATTLGPALFVFALWAAPVVGAAIAHGGLVNVSPRLGREYPLLTSLGSWGLLLPLSLGGLAWSLRHRVESPMLWFAVATATFLALAVARGVYDWTLAGNATALHQGRVWPVAHLVAGALAGVCLAWGAEWFRRRSARAAQIAIALPLALGSVSPAIASVSLTRAVTDHEGGYVFGREDLASNSFVARAARVLGSDDVVQVLGSRKLAFHIFSFSGARLASYDDPRLEGNDLRIRYAALADDWNDTSAAGGFEPDYVIRPSRARPSGLLVGEYGDRDWVLIKT